MLTVALPSACSSLEKPVRQVYPPGYVPVRLNCSEPTLDGSSPRDEHRFETLSFMIPTSTLIWGRRYADGTDLVILAPRHIFGAEGSVIEISVGVRSPY